MQQIEARLARLEEEGQPLAHEIVVKPVAALTVAVFRTSVPHVHEMEYYCKKLTQQIYSGLAEAGTQPLQPELILYHGKDYQEADLDVEAAVAIHPKYLRQPVESALTFRQIPGYDTVAALIYEGALREVVPSVLMLLEWVAASRHVPIGALREIHLSGPAHGNGVVEEAMVTELQLPIAPIDTIE